MKLNKKTLQKMAGKRRMVVVEVSPLTLCNKRCKHCFIPLKSLADPSVLKPDKIEYLLSVIKLFLDKVTSSLDEDDYSLDITMLGGELLLMPLEYNLKNIDTSSDFANHFSKKSNFSATSSHFTSNLIFPTNKEDNFDIILDKIEDVNKHRDHLSFSLSSSFDIGTNRFDKPETLERFMRNAGKLKGRNMSSVGLVTSTSETVKVNPASIQSFLIECGFQEIIYDMFHSFGSGKENEYLHPDWKQYNDFMMTYLLTDHINGACKNASDEIPKKGGSFVENKVGVPLMFISLSSEGCSFVFNDNIECNFKGSVSLEEIESLSREDAANLLYSKWEEYLSIIYKRTLKIKNCLGCDVVEYCQSGFYGNVYGFGNEHKVKEMFADKFDRCPIYDTLSSFILPSKLNIFAEKNNYSYDHLFEINKRDFSGISSKDAYEVFFSKNP